MKPVDFRNATYWSLRTDLDNLRRDAFRAWLDFGPGTTRQIADVSGMSILTLRPRTTDLIDMGLVVLAEHQPSKTEGVYRAATMAEWEAFRAEKIGNQMEMAL